VDTKQLVASLVSSLAWPLAAVVLALMFRQQLASLLRGGGPLKRLKAGPVEFEFDRVISDVESKIEPGPGEEKESYAGRTVAEELMAVAKASPRAAVMEAFALVEQEIRGRMRVAGHPRADAKQGAVRLAREAREAGVITAESLEAVEGMAVLRNLAAHDGEQVSERRALDYLNLADALLFALRRGARPDDQRLQ
jgi:hypothetical protein